MSATDSRQALIRVVHVAKRELGLDEEAYRDVLQSATGKRSTSDMAEFELRRLLDHLKTCGFKVKSARKSARKHDVPMDQHEQSRKIRALWLQLADMGIIRDPSEAALCRWIKRETGVEALAWLDGDQASHSIEKLKKWNQRIIRRREEELVRSWNVRRGPLAVAVFKMARQHLGRGAEITTLNQAEFAMLAAKRYEDYAL